MENQNIINIKVDFNAYYSEKSKKFDGGLYPILQYLKDNNLKDVLIRLDIDRKNETTWDEVDIFCKELSIKKLDYSINDKKYPKYTAYITCNYRSGKSLIKFLSYIAQLGNGGHSYSMLIGDKTFYFDGDGADHISSINDTKLTSEIFTNMYKLSDILKKGAENNDTVNETINLTDKELKKIIKESPNKHLIRIINIPDYGRNHNMYCDKVLWLRKARKPGDTEVVNNTVLGILRRNNIQFEILNMNENKKYEPMKDLNKLIKESVQLVLKEASNSQIKRKIINQLYKHTQDLTSHLYRDDNWAAVSKAFKTIEYIIGDSGELEVYVKNGGYVKDKDGTPMYKEYNFNIILTNGIEIGGSLKCHAAGTMEDAFEKYDMTITFW
jgi:hypothetical protein